MKKKIVDELRLLFTVYFVATFAWLLLAFLRITRWMKVVHPENIPKLRGVVVIPTNHGNAWGLMLETFIGAIFYPQFVLAPKKAPYATPDKHNFLDKPGWCWLKSRAVAIPRNSNGSSVAAAKKLIEILSQKDTTLVIQPEGGRTDSFRGDVRGFSYSKSGLRRMRPLKDFVGLVAARIPDVTIVPMWIEDDRVGFEPPPESLYSFPKFWRRLFLKVGKPIRTNGKSAAEIMASIKESLLELADEE